MERMSGCVDPDQAAHITRIDKLNALMSILMNKGYTPAHGILVYLPHVHKNL